METAAATPEIPLVNAILVKKVVKEREQTSEDFDAALSRMAGAPRIDVVI